MEKRSLGIAQTILAFLGLFFIILGYLSTNHFDFSYLNSFLFDDAKAIFSWGFLILILMGIQTTYKESIFWQSKIMHIIISILLLFSIFLALMGFGIFVLIFLFLFIQQIQNMTNFANRKVLGWIEFGLFILILILSGSFIFKSFNNGPAEGMVFGSSDIIVFGVIPLFSSCIILLLYVIFNLSSKSKKKK